MAKKGISPNEIIENINTTNDNEEYDFSTDSEREDEQPEVKEHSDIESESEIELIAKSFNEDNTLNELIKGGVQRLRRFITKKQESKTKIVNPTPVKMSNNNTFLNKKRKHEN